MCVLERDSKRAFAGGTETVRGGRGVSTAYPMRVREIVAPSAWMPSKTNELTGTLPLPTLRR